MTENMAPSISPKGVREAVEALIGISVGGVVERLCVGDDVTYSVCTPEGKLLCIPDGESWTVLLLDDNDKPRTKWSNAITDATETGAYAVKVILQEKGHTTEPLFHSERHELDLDIVRKTYTTQAGPVRLNTRRITAGTELVVEVVSTSLFLRCIHNKSSGAIILDDIEVLGRLPF